MSIAFWAFLSLLMSSCTFCPCARIKAFCSPTSFLSSSPEPFDSASRIFSPATSCLRSSDLSLRDLFPRRFTSASKGSEAFLGSKTKRPTSKLSSPSLPPSSVSRRCCRGRSRAPSAVFWASDSAIRASRTTWALALSTSDWRFRRSSRSSASLRSSFWCNSARELGEASPMSSEAPPADPALCFSFRFLPVRDEPAPLLPAPWSPSSRFTSNSAASTSMADVLLALAGSRFFWASCMSGWS
mmetsp:Transcript_85737/g.227836  ORF Transcript_85737/g.227836 Transcript_85737/m.227836 type:complete len:242 (-) Transcript_85737:161-886(-)